jgi:flavin reductase (DIM6/NTAB) family NADH-FMN oxidoreductase RutF
MMKIQVGVSKVNFPMPVVLVSCQMEEKLDIITISWISMISLNPPTLMVSFLKSRHSLSLIQQSGKFAVNVPSRNDVDSVNHCGIVSGKDSDKFKDTGYTPFYSEWDSLTPMIMECPINVLCKTVQSINYEDRIVLFGLVEEVFADSNIVTENQKIDHKKAHPFLYWMSGSEYWDIGSFIRTVKEGKK